MEHRHFKILQKERESLHERFLAAKGEEKTQLLTRILELDEEMEALKSEFNRPATSEQ